MKNSYFKAGLLDVILENLLVVAIILVTLGLGTPWAIAHNEKWLAENTIIDGKRLVFTGTGGDLFGKWIIWVLLTVITFGIYGLWLSLNYKKWVVENTHLEE